MAQHPPWSCTTASDAGRIGVPVIVCGGVTSHGAPVNASREYWIGQQAYLVCNVKGIAEGVSHRLSVRWLLDGNLVQAAGAHIGAVVMQSGAVLFSMIYSYSGTGLARVYWDEPVGDNNDNLNGDFLAHTVEFTVS